MTPLPGGIDVYIVEELPNPSTDFFVLPQCDGQGRRIHRCGFDEVPPAGALAGAAVVFVRYLPHAWRTRIQQERSRLAALVYFMDDDLFDRQAAVGMPWRYRYKLYTLAGRHEQWLRRQHASLWVSTSWLASKYSAWQPQVISPRPVSAGGSYRRVFYHGTASHDAEIRWLRPVMEEVLRVEPTVLFEIIGGPDVVRLYRGIQRVTVVQPMKWPTYQAFMDTPVRHIGLAPVLDVPFNRARSHTKFFDITRCGAAGIYTEGTACAEVVRPGADGIVLPLEPSEWAGAIVHLARDEARRLEILHNAQHTLAAR